MPKPSTLFSFTTFLIAVAALVVGVLAYVESWMNQPLDPAPVMGEVAIADVAGVRAAETDLRLELRALDEGGNTELLWHCGKTLLGQRHDYTAAWTQVRGAVLCDPESGTLRAGELHVAVGAMRGHGREPAPNALIQSLRENRWFLIEEHPTAVFRTTAATPRANGETASFEGAVDGWTHTLTGTLALNGVEKELRVAARVEVSASGVRLDAAFPISREAYGIEARGGASLPAEVDDRVVVEVRIHASRDPMAVVAQLNGEIVALQRELGATSAQTRDAMARLDRVEQGRDELLRRLAGFEEQLAQRPANARAGEAAASALPARFADFVDYRNREGDERYADLGYEPTFEMVLVPGDPAQGIEPFYAQTTEVTWEMFRAWSYCEDIIDEPLTAELRGALLRPTPCYDDASRGHGFEGRAALGISRRNAQAFCRYMSERTGRPYRLMTDAEWRYIAAATGGLPDDPTSVGWFAENNEGDDFGDPISMPVAQKPANEFGLHDFWGNVAEWVMDDEEFIRGGSYLVSAEDLALEWREDASQDVWNETYPNTPKSLWWYRDRFDMGFRLVCDPVNIPTGN